MKPCYFFFSSSFLIFTFILFFFNGTFKIEELKPLIPKKRPLIDRKIFILAWNSYWNWPDFGLGEGNKAFEEHACPLTNCYLTTKRIDFHLVDAVLMHGHGMSDTSDIRKNMAFALMAGKKPPPLMVYFNKESPGGKASIFDDLINITMTYRRDSNVFNGYGRLVPTSKEAQEAFKRGEWLSPTTIDNGDSQSLYDKSKDIAWMVSHCQTESKRENIAQAVGEISKLKVDILGKCGQRILPPETSKSVGETLKNRMRLYKDHLAKYKFYLSFENSLCEDYITEKFYLALYAGAIPIVYGGKSSEDYKKAAPPMSYINVEDFSSIKSLNEYLTELSNNASAYNDFFWWRSHYKVETLAESQFKSFCDLCTLLNQLQSGEATLTDLYRDFRHYWNPSKVCRASISNNLLQ